MVKLNKKGFTLAELLIVVAIIAVLVAVAIPTFNSQLEKSRQGVDVSNLRGAFAAARIAQMGQEVDGVPIDDDNYQFWYDPDSGNLTAADTADSTQNAPDTYGKAASKKLVADTSGLNETITYKGDTIGQLPTANEKGILVTFTKDDGTYKIFDISFQKTAPQNATAPALLFFGTAPNTVQIPTVKVNAATTEGTEISDLAFTVTPAGTNTLTYSLITTNDWVKFGTGENASKLVWNKALSADDNGTNTTIYIKVEEKSTDTGTPVVKTYFGKFNLQISDIPAA